MWDVENQVVFIVAFACIVPANQSLVYSVDIANEVRERLPYYFDLRDIAKDLWVGAEIDILTLSFGLREKFKTCKEVLEENSFKCIVLNCNLLTS